MKGYPRKAELLPEAERLRAEGLSVAEIAERLGQKWKTVWNWLDDPDGSKHRARVASYRGECSDCGAPTDGSNGRGPKAAQRCRACSNTRNGERRREESRPLRELIERMWAEGASSRAIAEAVGWNAKTPSARIATCRARGYDLPVRNRGASGANQGAPGLTRWRERRAA